MFLKKWDECCLQNCPVFFRSQSYFILWKISCIFFCLLASQFEFFFRNLKTNKIVNFINLCIVNNIAHRLQVHLNVSTTIYCSLKKNISISWTFISFFEFVWPICRTLLYSNHWWLEIYTTQYQVQSEEQIILNGQHIVMIKITATIECTNFYV